MGWLAKVGRVHIAGAIAESEAPRGVAQRETVEQATVAEEMRGVKGVRPLAVEGLADLPVGSGEFAFHGAQEAVVAARQAGGRERVVADAGGEDGARGLVRSVLHLHADKVDERSALASVERSCEESKAVDDAIAREFVVEDGQMALLERADADAGGLKFGAGEEHEFAKTRAQVAFRRDFRGGFCAHDADLVSGPGEIGKRLAGLVDGWGDHLRGHAGRTEKSDRETGDKKGGPTKNAECDRAHETRTFR